MKNEEEIKRIQEMAQVMCSGCPYEDDCNYQCSYKDKAKKLYRAGYGNIAVHRAEIDRLENAIKDSDERIYDLTEQANAKLERLQKEMADVLLCVRYSKGGDFDLEKYKKRVIERFAEKLKTKIGDIGVYAFTEEDIDELLKEYE